MGFRFQKRLKILPGISVNLSKSGISTSIGPRGAKVTLGNGKRRTTVSLPGTGLSHTTSTNTTDTSSGKRSGADLPASIVKIVLWAVAIIIILIAMFR